jgi:hypothetical protein
MKLLNSSSSHGWCRRFFKWVGERERERQTERERDIDRQRERDSLLMVWVGERERLFIAVMGGMGTETVK